MATMLAPEAAGAATATAAGAAAPTEKHWLEATHSDYDRQLPFVKYARDVYSGGLLHPDRIHEYLRQRPAGESDDAYEERRDLADFTNYFANVVDGYVGMLANVDGEAVRIWTPKDDPKKGLGDPTDPTSPAGRLLQQADAEGRGWTTVWDLLAAELAIAHAAWPVVSSAGVARAPRVNILPYERVPNWRHDGDGQLVEALVTLAGDFRQSLGEPAGTRRRFLQYVLVGEHTEIYSWELDTRTKVGTEFAPKVTARFVAPDGNPALPIWRAELALRRHVGYLMARKNVVLFNQESTLDHLLRTCGHPRFSFAGTRLAFEQAVKDFQQGVNLLHQPNDSEHQHQYLSPPSEPAKILLEVIKAKVEAFYVTASKEYGDSASGGSKTATEVRQDVSSGAAAFLHMQKVALDDAETNAGWRVAQVLHPDDPRQWHVFRVARTNDFLPTDPRASGDSTHKRLFGSDRAVPVGINAKVAAALELADAEGVSADEVQVRAAVILAELTGLYAAFPELPLPAKLKAHLLTLTMIANGMLAGDEATAALDGLNVAELLKEAEKDAEAAADHARVMRDRESQAFPNSGAGGNADGGAGGGAGGSDDDELPPVAE